MDLVTTVVIGIFAGLGLLLIVGVLQMNQLIRMLRDRHGKLYASLGSPTLILNNSVSTSARLMAFIWTGRFRETSDQQLIRCASRLRVIQAAYCILFAGALCLFFLAITETSATSLGLFSPQAGVGYTYSWHVGGPWK